MKKTLFACIFTLLLTCPAWAGNGHYVPGVEGIKVASVPPPGFYLMNYLATYNADRLNQPNGMKNTNLNWDVDVICNAIRPLWVTDYKILGADYATFVTIPITYTHVKYTNYGGDTRTGVGDIDFTPILLAWHFEQFDLAFGYELFLPVGDYSENHPASPGKNFWTHMVDFGGTYFFDKDKTWSLSALLRYETHTENDKTDIQFGDDLIMEWGLGKQIGLWEGGIAGYFTRQISDDSGSGVVYDKDKHDSASAIGPELARVFPELGVRASLRFLHEYRATDQGQGNMGTLTLVKMF